MGPNNHEKEPYPMVDILNLALPYFGLIFIGFACGKAKGLPEQGLAWMNFFPLYVSLPALLFGIMSKTPFAELNNPPFPFGRVPWEVPAVIAVKLLIHPLIVFGLMLLMGPFPQPWATTAILMASLAGPERVRDRPATRDLDRAGIRRRPDRNICVRHHAHPRDVVHPDRPAGVSVGPKQAAVPAATKAPGPRASPDGEAARSNRSDAGRPRASFASEGNRSAAIGSPYR